MVLPEPKFEEIGDGIKVTVYRANGDKQNGTDDTNIGANGTNSGTNDAKTPKHQSTDDFGALDDALVQRIIEVIKQKPGISQDEMAEELGTTRRVIQNKMVILKEIGRIERIGGKRYGHWEIRD